MDDQTGNCQVFSVNIENQSGNKSSPLELYQREGTCEDFGYISLQSTRKCLKLYDTQMTWLKANNTCASAGGKLFGITSSVMFDEVLNATSRKDPSFHITLIDGTDIDSEGNWVYSDGSPLLYHLWDTGEPDGGTDENCLCMIGEFFHDGPCDSSMVRFICEKQFTLSLK
ncbi:low affinity immunoglobulin epsilon Fc receptor-like [Saccostrea cucullata]|uniref:low affinity immunoglobulin epsilon Fc receptor-like n=1 Tax=Saccostrea cuccullata TaxID=36930 RepID=UPI002ED5F393